MCGLLLFVQLCAGTVFGCNKHRYSKELTFYEEIMYYLRIDKIGLTPFCFLGPDITLSFSVVACTGSAVLYCSHEQLGDRSMEIASGYRHT